MKLRIRTLINLFIAVIIFLFVLPILYLRLSRWRRQRLNIGGQSGFHQLKSRYTREDNFQEDRNDNEVPKPIILVQGTRKVHLSNFLKEAENGELVRPVPKSSEVNNTKNDSRDYHRAHKSKKTVKKKRKTKPDLTPWPHFFKEIHVKRSRKHKTLTSVPKIKTHANKKHKLK